MDAELVVLGRYTIQHIRDGKVIDEWSEDNIVVNQGLDHALSVVFAGASPVSQWYIGLFKGNYTPVGTDTAATFPGNAQEATSYGQSRQAFYATEAAQNANNSARPAVFTFQSADTIYGAFLTSANAVGSGQGTLFSAVAFSTSRAVVTNDQLSIQYGVAGSSG